MYRTDARRVHKGQTFLQERGRAVQLHLRNTQMVVAVLLLIDVRRHLVESDLLDDAVVKSHRRGFFAIFNRRYDRGDRHDADRKNLVLQNRVDQCTFSALELSDDRNGYFLVFQLVAKLFGTRKLALGDLIFAEGLARLLHNLDHGPFLLFLCRLHL